MNGKTRGRFLIILGSVLLVFSGIALVGALQQPRFRDPSIESLLAHPDGYAVAGTIGVLIGSNIFSILAGLFGLYALIRKNPNAKALIIASLIFLLINSSILFMPPSESTHSNSNQIMSQSDAKSMAEELSRALEGISKENITKQLIEKLNDAPTQYTSLSDGFTVYFPSAPQQNTIENLMGATIKNYQSFGQDGIVQYNVFFNYFDKKILSEESQETYLNGHLAGKLLSSKNSRVVANNRTVFRGFNANRYKYVDVLEGVEVLREGIVFILDGDSVSLTCVYLKAVDPQPSFDEFMKSFELLPLEARLSDELWKDLSTGLVFRPPIDMKPREKKRSKSVIVTFANKAGHSLTIINVTAEYPSFKLSDIMKEFSQAARDSEGFLVNNIHDPTLSMDFLQLVKLLEHGDNIFMLQAYAPKQTFFRSERIFKESINTVTFEK